jgi:uncharacterized lipoprotein NlpE involved in copper resistance
MPTPMKTIKHLSLILIAAMALMACQQSNKNDEKTTENQTVENESQENIKATQDQHNSRNSLDWDGIYQGVIPCADCEGIKTKMMLAKDGTYERTTVYLGRSEETFIDQGTFSWNDDNSIITINLENNDTQQYQVGENVLFFLDKEGNRITGSLADNYNLTKNRADNNLENKTWVLIELLGQPVEDTKNVFVMFVSEKGILTGSDGCNRFNGGYELLEGSRYTSGPFMTTLMACDDMENSKDFLEVVEKSDTYIVSDSTLSITKARMAVMAKFKLKEEE